MQTLLPTYFLGIGRKEIGLMYFNARSKLYDITQNGEGNICTVKQSISSQEI